MRKRNTILFLLILLSVCARSQTSNWSAYLPALFPTNVSGQIHGISRVSQMKFHPTNSSKIYAVSARGGLFISTNGGTSWTVTPGTDKIAFCAFASVCIDFSNDQILYLGAGDHNYYYSWGGATGVWKSTDGGLNFTQTTLNNKIIVEMIMDPNDHNIVVAATNGGIYKTTNGGSTWTLKSTSREFDDLKQKTPVSRTLFAATRDSAFFRSNDFGETWSQITTGIVLPAEVTNGNGCRIAVTPADTNIVYFGMTANSGLLYKSTNGGTSFTAVKTSSPPYLTYYDNLSTSSGQGDYNFGIGVDRTNANIIYLVAHNVWKSTDGGVNWTQLTNWWMKVHTDMHQIMTSPYNNGQLWNANDGGVWLSTDGGNNWSPKSDGIYGYEIYHGNCSPTRRDMISIGTQDNGELYSTTSGWFTNRGGDWGSKCAFDYRSNSSMVYYLNRNTRRLVTGSDQTYGLPANVTAIDDIAFHRSNPGLAFVADTFIYRTTNLTVTTPTWTSIYNINKKVMAMHCSFADQNRLYIITSDGFIYVSTNALSASPTFVSYTLPNSSNNSASITSIKNSANTIYISINTKVYRSVDNGATWTNITYNLPSVNHVRIIADEYYSNSELVFLGSNNAVYTKVAGAVSWTIFNANLPSRTSIEDMSIYNDSTNNSVLRVATYGRGIWETSISGARTLTADFIANKINPCPGGTVQFTDLSRGNVTTRSWSFPGGTPSSSTAINPSVVYNSSGTYNVTLTAGDGVSTNSITRSNYISTLGSNLQLSEGFEGIDDPPTGWINNDNGTTGDLWVKTSSASGFGTSANSMMFDNYSWNVPGERDELQVKRVDFTGYNNITLTFDVAYQVFTGYSDSLAVLISTDCGNTFTRVYIKGGTNLSTAGSGGNNFVPTAAQWRTETVNLTGYSGQSSVIIQFQNINGYGNKLYIDNVNINATVAASAGADQNICSGTSVSIGMTAVSGINYSWSPTTGLNSPTSSNPLASPSSTTTYILTATQPLSGISSKDTVVVNVTPSGTLSVTIAASPSSSVCTGTNVTFTATALNSGLTPVYVWKKNGSIVGTNSNTYSSSTLVTGDNITGSVINSSACITGSPATSTPITMTVNPNLIASVSITANPTGNICPGTNVIFTATPVNGGTASYAWKKNNLSTGITGSTYSTNTLVNGDIINCVMTSSLPCLPSNPVVSNSITETIIPSPVITSFAPASGVPGSSVTISGSSFINVTSVNFNGLSSSYIVNNASQITATVPAGATSGQITVITNCGNSVSTNSYTVQAVSANINLRVFIDGFYRGNGTMTEIVAPNICDTVTLELHQNVTPYSLVASVKNTINTSGYGTFTFSPNTIGNSYYLVVKHRNALETWSALPVTLSSNTSYDFTTSAGQAHGNNQKNLNDGRFAIYSGDVDHSGNINDNDITFFETAVLSFSTGYLVTDLNGDNITESADFSLLENNVFVHPGVSMP